MARVGEPVRIKLPDCRLKSNQQTLNVLLKSKSDIDLISRKVNQIYKEMPKNMTVNLENEFNDWSNF